MKIKVYILALLAVAMATFLLVHFGMIWTYGQFFVKEPNTPVLCLETVMMVSIFGFSFYCLIDQLRKPKKTGKDSQEQRRQLPNC
jgi:hypothetical protein